MFALIQIINFLASFTPIIIVHKYELPGHRIIKIRLSHQGVRTKHDLLFFRDKYTLVKVITHYQFYVVPLNYYIILKECVTHGFPEFAAICIRSKMPMGLKLGI